MDEGEERLELDVGLTEKIQQSNLARQKKALQTGMPRRKLVQKLTMDGARDMYAKDAMAAFCEHERNKGKKL